jgi:hypothetical protein
MLTISKLMQQMPSTKYFRRRLTPMTAIVARVD